MYNTATLRRSAYLIGYDVSDSRRRRAARRAAVGYATSTQRSFFECLLAERERDGLMVTLRGIIDPRTDRVLAVRMDAREPPERYGLGLESGNDQAVVIA